MESLPVVQCSSDYTSFQSSWQWSLGLGEQVSLDDQVEDCKVKDIGFFCVVTP